MEILLFEIIQTAKQKNVQILPYILMPGRKFSTYSHDLHAMLIPLKVNIKIRYQTKKRVMA